MNNIHDDNLHIDDIGEGVAQEAIPIGGVELGPPANLAFDDSV